MYHFFFLLCLTIRGIKFWNLCWLYTINKCISCRNIIYILIDWIAIILKKDKHGCKREKNWRLKDFFLFLVQKMFELKFCYIVVRRTWYCIYLLLYFVILNTAFIIYLHIVLYYYFFSLPIIWILLHVKIWILPLKSEYIIRFSQEI